MFQEKKYVLCCSYLETYKIVSDKILAYKYEEHYLNDQEIEGEVEDTICRHRIFELSILCVYNSFIPCHSCTFCFLVLSLLFFLFQTYDLHAVYTHADCMRCILSSCPFFSFQTYGLRAVCCLHEVYFVFLLASLLVHEFVLLTSELKLILILTVL